MIQEIAELFRSLWVVWLGLLFIGIVAWALWPSNKARFEHASRIPLDDDEPQRGETAGTRRRGAGTHAGGKA
ncbi:MAG: cbb3-type cytochrome c oxidase subunit 3 [Alphaproteobacteria bacterium]